MNLDDIATVRIHPAIGIARVGNSPDGWFLGPERPGVHPTPEHGEFKDEAGRVKRQAVRFRCFGFNRNGDQWLELTHSPDAAIEWTVHVANRKAAALRFVADTPRNKGMNREDMVIDPGPRTLAGPGGRARFDGGRFALNPVDREQKPGVEVPLGEMWTEPSGHLMVLGALGYAASPAGRDCTDFADNDGWYDDSCDGPVDAVVRLKGRAEPLFAERAWLITAPPKYAPQLEDVVTLWDQLVDLFADGRDTELPPSYTEDIQPILRRAGTMGAVNQAAGGRIHAGWPEPLYGYYGRRKVTGWLRPLGFENPKGEVGEGMPKLAGNPRPHLTGVQYAAMMRWRDGDFERDWAPSSGPEQAEPGPAGSGGPVTPDGLDRSALEAAVGTVFEPGIEAGRFFLNKDNWAQPHGSLRFDRKIGPGDVSARMAVPWQADFFACGEFWWPVSRPNQVLPKAGSDYLAWDRGIGNIRRMVDFWDHPGFVVAVGSAGYLERQRRQPPVPEPWVPAAGQWTTAVAGPGPGGDGHAGVWQHPGQLAGADLAAYGRGEPFSGQVHRWPFRLTESDRAVTVRLRAADPGGLAVVVRTPYGVVLTPDDARRTQAGAGLAVTRQGHELTLRIELPVEVAPQRFTREGEWEVEVRAPGRGAGSPYQLTVEPESELWDGSGDARRTPDGSVAVTVGLGGARVATAAARLLARRAEQVYPALALADSGGGVFGGAAPFAPDAVAVRLTVTGTSALGYPFDRERFLSIVNFL
ncbi:LodA/GoxA family CTQ-dependent oxidase [Saccharothrix sp. ST-888]|uniref:LodA/GoxA family CTQ-dependent oxidase n=1 Tax=Saccharothrix sp. ST-888 TaxID=1427391 RepID=UPI0006964B16|nr:LodA/GoxA family CTQ-dependent oxidase [Saccharothrix sp. ST-888]